MVHRIPRGFSRVSWPFQPLMEPGWEPSYKIRPALFLPVAADDTRHDDPIVLIPGTFVGRLDRTAHSALDASFNVEDGPLVPACSQAYTITYGARDLVDSVYEGTPDIDVDADTVAAAAGASSATVAAVLPLGIVVRPIYAGWLETRHTNYVRQLHETWRSRALIVRIPAVTANEAAIQIGQKVMLDDTTTPTWDPWATTPVSVGRIMAWDGTLANVPYMVGRCVNKYRIGKQVTPTANQTLRAALGSSVPTSYTNFDPAYLWEGAEGDAMKAASKVETAQGLGLSSSSEVAGRTSDLLFARADASGDFWAIEIELDC